VATQRPWANILIPLRFCGASSSVTSRTLAAAPLAMPHSLMRILAALGLLFAAPSPSLLAQSSRRAPVASSARESTTAEKELAQLARALREGGPAAYARLSEFASRHPKDELGVRAALALGYYDFTKDLHAQAQRWLDRALARAPRQWLLREYALFWRAQAREAVGNHAGALADLDSLRREFPASVLTDQVVEIEALAELALGQADRAVAALEGYDKVGSKPSLLLLRAQAHQQAGQTASAADDYLGLYYGFPLSDEAKAAGAKIPELGASLGEQFPGVPTEQQLGRAAALFDAHRWHEARSAYEDLLPKISGIERQRAQLRIAESDVQLGGSPSALASLAVSEPEPDAERLYALSQAFRTLKQEGEMLSVVEQLAAHYPQSRWTEEGLFGAGNYFWVNLERGKAAQFYQRVWQQFPAGKNAQAAHWRLAWVAYLERHAQTASLLEQHVRTFPSASLTPDALYWLGRTAERAGEDAHARSFYLKARERFPQTYFGARAAERLRTLGEAPVNVADFLALIPAPPPLPQFDAPIPPRVEGNWARAQALRTIAFDASAELELRSAYASAAAPRLLWAAAEAALDARHYSVSITLARQVIPQLEARRIEELPLEVWRTLCPLPYEASLKRAAARQKVDPMLVAGIIRQESAFQADAVSRAGAVGLMQVLPKTGHKVARQLHVRYARARLLDPEYNLQLGTRYLADLLSTLGTPESALAAFNAGEERVAAWQAERNFEEPAEFVESIPFTETRDYVQIVMRNAQLYHQLYEERR
jgi:soluble lytic murein transglycosylase